MKFHEDMVYKDLSQKGNIQDIYLRKSIGVKTNVITEVESTSEVKDKVNPS